MKIDKSIYSALEKILHIQRLLKEKLNRVPTTEELYKECEFDSEHVSKVLVAADGSLVAPDQFRLAINLTTSCSKY